MERPDDLVQLLPDDVLADILHHLAPRSLAASRCVCKVWRAVIDDRRLLRADNLPLSLGGIFTNFDGLWWSHFVSRPLTGSIINGDFHYFVRDHCNGLLLLLDDVVNPATQQSAYLPEPPPPQEHTFENQHLVFDPTESLQYEVVSVPHVNAWTQLNSRTKKSEWPPSPCIMHVFSSRTGRWEKRCFVRQGNAAGTITDMVLDNSWYDKEHNAVYWREALYVNCQTDFVMRISLSNNTYRVIKPPIVSKVPEDPKLFLGRSKKGVCCASLDDQYRLRTWFLDESCGRTEWVLKHDKTLRPFLPHINYGEKTKGSWILHIYAKSCYGVYDDNESTMEKKFEWDSDNDDIVDAEDRAGDCDHGYVSIIGFHPYKEVVFLERSGRGLAYHLNSSKLQYLGKLFPDSYEDMYPKEFKRKCFTYTPCWIGEFPDAN